MGIEHEEAVRGFLLAFEGESLDSAQIEQIVSRMAPDARYHIFAWEEPFVGHDAIRDELLRHAAMTSDGRFEFVNIASAGQIVFVERVDFATINGKRAGFHVVGVLRSMLTARSRVGATTWTAERSLSCSARTALDPAPPDPSAYLPDWRARDRAISALSEIRSADCIANRCDLCLPRAMTTRTAQCACGRLQVTVQGEPLAVMLCHCDFCQKRSGSVYAVTAQFSPEQVVEISGETKTFNGLEIDGVGVAGSDIGLEYHFCTTCGSTVYRTMEGDPPPFFAIGVGNFVEPDFPAPVVETYTAMRHHWVPPVPTAAQFEAFPAG